MMETLIYFMIYAASLLIPTQSESICVWGTFGYTKMNGEYELAGQYNGKPYYKQKQCQIADENPNWASQNVHLYYADDNLYHFSVSAPAPGKPQDHGYCETTGINSPNECKKWWPTDWFSSMKILAGKCPDILEKDSSYTSIEITNGLSEINGIYDIRIGRNMFKKSSTSPIYLMFDPYTFKWRFIMHYSKGDNAWKGSYSTDLSCPASRSTYDWKYSNWIESADVNTQTNADNIFRQFNAYPDSYTVNMKYGPTITLNARNIQPTPAPTLNPSEYNLINPYPYCFYSDKKHCNDMYTNKDNINDITHPNYEERLTATLINMARLFPNEYRINNKYGFANDPTWTYPKNPNNYHTGFTSGIWGLNNFCGKANSVPLYYNQKLNEASRFHNWDAANCEGYIAHLTCSTRCDLFDSYTDISKESKCAAASRWAGFIAMNPYDGTSISGGEGVCSINGCYKEDHCHAMFDPYDASNNQWRGSLVIGIGKWKGSNTYDILYGIDNNNKDINSKKYPIVYGTHLDGRYYRNYAQRDAANAYKAKAENMQKITFLLQWYGVTIGNIAANSVHLIFRNNEYTMNKILGDSLSGFYEITFEMNSDDNKHYCEPYAFYVETINNNKYRLPENKNYFFGTAFFKSYDMEPLYQCNENHYYKNSNNKWLQNNGPLNLITSNIEQCTGCSKAVKLEQFDG
eukprot:366921_1